MRIHRKPGAEVEPPTQAEAALSPHSLSLGLPQPSPGFYPYVYKLNSFEHPHRWLQPSPVDCGWLL